MNFTDLTKTLDLLASSDSQNLNNILRELSDLNDFLASLSSIDRSIILKKIKIFAESDARKVHYDSKTQTLSPQYLKMDFVHWVFLPKSPKWGN
ncbi:hypothetical protein E8M24_32755 [Bacillus thuringiensis]|uniref:hypothetical protein n=1 Tax=Bacillus thuringiensis TaxID=1428 RepID=UPI00125ED6B8|nr:hypothetical protein [Bacillus thuringiensis]KAB5623892.1 hypothetical protein E8M24_32755 [Bacillus thuringiensis]HDR5272602.1 hypothetical protein [Bacillus thuringiensis]